MRTTLTCLLSCAIWLAAAPAFAAIDAYLLIDGVHGESTKPGHTGSIELTSFSVGVTRGGSMGAGAGQGKVSSITVIKRTDKTSPLLHEALSTGKPFKVATIDVAKDAGQKAYLQFTMTNVMVSRFTMSDNNANGGIPTETITFVYGAMKVQYQPQKPDGSLGGWAQVTPEELEKVLPPTVMRYVDTAPAPRASALPPPRAETAAPAPK